MVKAEVYLTDKILKQFLKFTNQRYDDLGEHEFKKIYQEMDSNLYVLLRDLLFKLITGEDNFDKFYDRFDAPALADGKKPVAWTRRFIPDIINDDLMSLQITTADKYKRVLSLYKKCRRLEKKHENSSNKRCPRKMA